MANNNAGGKLSHETGMRAHALRPGLIVTPCAGDGQVQIVQAQESRIRDGILTRVTRARE